MPDTIDAAAERDEAAALFLDLTGLKCPLPALRTRKALRASPPGSLIVVVATDPLAGLDIPNVVREEGARIETRTGGDAGGTSPWRFTIRSAG